MNVNRKPSLYSETPTTVHAKTATASQRGMQNPVQMPESLDIQNHTVVYTQLRTNEDSFMQTTW